MSAKIESNPTLTKVPPKASPWKGNKVAQLVEARVAASSKAQKEIAAAIGYDKPHIITMFKRGLTKVPIRTAPRLALELGLDPEEFARMCLQKYTPGFWK